MPICQVIFKAATFSSSITWGRDGNGKDAILALESIFPAGIGPLMSYLIQLSQHPMYEEFQTLLSQNISKAFKRFPNIEKHWDTLYKQHNVDANVAAFYGNQFGASSAPWSQGHSNSPLNLDTS